MNLSWPTACGSTAGWSQAGRTGVVLEGCQVGGMGMSGAGGGAEGGAPRRPAHAPRILTFTTTPTLTPTLALAYPLAPGAEHITVLRVVCREDFSTHLARALLADLQTSLAKLQAHVDREDKEKASILAAARATSAWRSSVQRASSMARAVQRGDGA